MNAPSSDRRTDIVNELNTRIAILEASHQEVVRVRQRNDVVIEGLLKHDSEMLLALNTISLKFDKLIGQFAIGFKVLSVCCLVLITVVSAFWTYSHQLDLKYAPKVDLAVQSLKANTKSIQQQKEAINDIGSTIETNKDQVHDVVDDVTTLKKKRVIRASK